MPLDTGPTKATRERKRRQDEVVRKAAQSNSDWRTKKIQLGSDPYEEMQSKYDELKNTPFTGPEQPDGVMTPMDLLMKIISGPDPNNDPEVKAGRKKPTEILGSGTAEVPFVKDFGKWLHKKGDESGHSTLGNVAEHLFDFIAEGADPSNIDKEGFNLVKHAGLPLSAWLRGNKGKSKGFLHGSPRPFVDKLTGKYNGLIDWTAADVSDLFGRFFHGVDRDSPSGRSWADSFAFGTKNKAKAPNSVVVDPKDYKNVLDLMGPNFDMTDLSHGLGYLKPEIREGFIREWKRSRRNGMSLKERQENLAHNLRDINRDPEAVMRMSGTHDAVKVNDAGTETYALNPHSHVPKALYGRVPLTDATQLKVTRLPESYTGNPENLPVLSAQRKLPSNDLSIPVPRFDAEGNQLGKTKSGFANNLTGKAYEQKLQDAISQQLKKTDPYATPTNYQNWMIEGFGENINLQKYFDENYSDMYNGNLDKFVEDYKRNKPEFDPFTITDHKGKVVQTGMQDVSFKHNDAKSYLGKKVMLPGDTQNFEVSINSDLDVNELQYYIDKGKMPTITGEAVLPKKVTIGQKLKEASEKLNPKKPTGILDKPAYEGSQLTNKDYIDHALTTPGDTIGLTHGPGTYHIFKYHDALSKDELSNMLDKGWKFATDDDVPVWTKELADVHANHNVDSYISAHKNKAALDAPAYPDSHYTNQEMIDDSFMHGDEVVLTGPDGKKLHYYFDSQNGAGKEYLTDKIKNGYHFATWEETAPEQFKPSKQDTPKGDDFELQTPGGVTQGKENVANYLKKMYGDAYAHKTSDEIIEDYSNSLKDFPDIWKGYSLKKSEAPKGWGSIDTKSDSTIDPHAWKSQADNPQVAAMSLESSAKTKKTPQEMEQLIQTAEDLGINWPHVKNYEELEKQVGEALVKSNFAKSVPEPPPVDAKSGPFASSALTKGDDELDQLFNNLTSPEKTDEFAPWDNRPLSGPVGPYSPYPPKPGQANPPVMPWENNNPFDPTNKVSELSQKYPDLATHYGMDSGTEIGSVGTHTSDVLKNYQSQLSPDAIAKASQELGVPDLDKTIADAVALHDIGKGAAVKAGDKTKQHEFTEPMMQMYLQQQGHSPQAIQFVKELFNHDLIGELNQGIGIKSTADVAQALKDKAAKVGVSPQTFMDVQMPLYYADAGSYPFVKDNFMKSSPEGKLSMKNSKTMDELYSMATAQTPEKQFVSSEVIKPGGLQSIIQSKKSPNIYIPQDIEFIKQLGGGHDAKLFNIGGNPHVFKQQKGHRNLQEEYGSKIANMLNPNVPVSERVNLPGFGQGVLQKYIEGAKPINPYVKNLGNLDQADLSESLVHDWVIGNHDAHHENFVKKPNGLIVPIDKGQAFKYWQDERLAPDYHPNAAYGSPKPIYSQLPNETGPYWAVEQAKRVQDEFGSQIQDLTGKFANERWPTDFLTRDLFKNAQQNKLVKLPEDVAKYWEK